MSNHSLRIVHLSDRFFPLVGGVERHVLEVSRYQRDRGHNVTIVTGLCANGLEPSSQVEGCQILRFPALRSPIRRHAWFLRNRDVFRAADVIHVHNVMIAGNFFLMPKMRRKSVLTLHGWGGRFPLPAAETLSAQRCAALFPAVVCIGHFIERWKHVVPTLVDYGGVNLPQTKPQAGRRGVLLLGRLAQDTGVAEFCSALKALHNPEIAPLQVTVAGDGPLRAEVAALAEHPGIELTMLGFTRDVFPLLAASRIVLTSGYLGILEALGMGARVISLADNPLKHDYLALSPMAEFIDIAHSASEATTMLAAALREDPARDELVARGVQFAQSRTWARVAEAYASLYPLLGVTP